MVSDDPLIGQAYQRWLSDRDPLMDHREDPAEAFAGGWRALISTLAGATADGRYRITLTGASDDLAADQLSNGHDLVMSLVTLAYGIHALQVGDVYAIERLPDQRMPDADRR